MPPRSTAAIRALVIGLMVGLMLAVLPMTAARSADWTEFRGPGQQGHSAETGLPLAWSETEHVAWKTDVPGLGWSSPAVAAGKVWITTGVDDGRSLRVLRLDASTGAIETNLEVFTPAEPGSVHSKNSHASPTPLIEGDRVYLHFGSHGTACFATDGTEIWKTKLDYNHRHGPAGSPVLCGDLLVISCDGTDVQFVVGLDKATGQEVWRRPRGEGRMAYSTPTVTEVDGRPLLISCGGEWVVAYEPATGEERWRFRYPGGYSNVPRPVTGFGLTFVSSGYDTPVFYALRLDGRGELGEDHVAWKTAKAVTRNSSPLLVGEELYMVSDNGVISCLDARTGSVHWQERLGGDCTASPLFADGRIYITDENGLTKVIAPGTTFQELAVNQLPGRTLASLAAADGALFLRTDSSLYRLDD
ncbi:MAG: pyrrolo-quinoline quinone [Planctomycetota bacterium]|nr:MAG: pyrrolo-quinoline quinone [Planctomycetota bacterium]